MTQTAVTLDPSAVASGRTALELNSGAIRIGPDGPDWGDAAIESAMAELARGSAPVDFRIPNRQIKIPLLLGADGADNFATAKRQLQQKVALFQSEGGWLGRGEGFYADIVNATLAFPDKHGTVYGVEGDVGLTLEAIPDFYGEETENVTDDFSVDSIASYSFDEGSGTLAVSGGKLSPTNTARKRLYHLAETYDDAQVTFKFTPGGATTNLEVGPSLRRLDGSNYLFATVTAAGVLSISKRDGGSNTSLGVTGTNLSGALASGTAYWIRFRAEGDLLTIEVFTSAPTATSTPAASRTVTLSGADATKFGAGVKGQAGIGWWASASTGEALDDLEIKPNRYVERTEPALRRVLRNIDGDYPGRVRVVVDDKQGQDQLGLIAAFRSRHYDSASTAALAYEAEALTPLDTAATATLSGAAGGASNNTIQHSNLGADWTPVLSTNLLAGTFLTHTGTYRVFARVYSTSGDDVKLRLVYDVGDLALPEENDPWTFPAASQFYLADLGEIRLDEVPVGSHRWQGAIQAKGAVGGESVRVDKLFLVPVDESMARLTAPINPGQGLASYSARDEFNQSAGALTGKTAPVGGVWVGAGDADDFAVETTGHTAQRATTSDSSSLGRTMTLDVNLATCAVQIDHRWSVIESGLRSGVVARYVNSSNMLELNLNGTTLEFRKRIAGVVTTLVSLVNQSVEANQWYTLRLYVDAQGRVFCWWGLRGASFGSPLIVTQDSDLATGGTLATGDVGFADEYGLATAVTRNYDNFAAWVPTRDAVVFAGRSAELRTDGMFREDSTGAGSGPISSQRGDLLRVPPAGLEGRPAELFVKASRGDLDQLPDNGIDDIAVQLFRRASWLFPPA